jgi:hypothetical protein
MRGWVCSLQLLLALTSAAILMSEFHRIHDHILLPYIRDFHNLEGQVPIFISPKDRMAQLYPQALGYLFVSSYDSQSHGGGIQPRLHTGVLSRSGLLLYNVGLDFQRKRLSIMFITE